MPVAPEWGTFWLQVSASAGVIALVLVDILLKYLPEPWRGYVTSAKAFVALLANYFVPLAVTALLGKWPTVDPLLWSAVYFAGSYLIHEVVYKFVQKPVAKRMNGGGK